MRAGVPRESSSSRTIRLLLTIGAKSIQGERRSLVARSRAQLARASLRRLGTAYVDLYNCTTRDGRDRRDDPFEDLERLREEASAPHGVALGRRSLARRRHARAEARHRHRCDGLQPAQACPAAIPRVPQANGPRWRASRRPSAARGKTRSNDLPKHDPRRHRPREGLVEGLQKASPALPVRRARRHQAQAALSHLPQLRTPACCDGLNAETSMSGPPPRTRPTSAPRTSSGSQSSTSATSTSSRSGLGRFTGLGLALV